MLESYIDSLRLSFGPLRPPIEEDRLRHEYNRQDYAAMVNYIRGALHLDMRVLLGLVNGGGERAPAWVVVPRRIPMLGTLEFRQTLITMYLRKSFVTEGCFEEVACAIAHELCHILLDSVRHPLHKQEEAVDLADMLMGFRDFYITGCRTIRNVSSQKDAMEGLSVREVRTQGYLTFDEVSYAATYMTFR